MRSYAALLRGVNVGGKSALEMNDLKDLAAGAGLQSVRTYIASGNLLFRSEHREEELRLSLEQRLQAHMGKPVRVMIRTASELNAVLMENPFVDVAANRVQVYFLNHSPPAELVRSARNVEDERIVLGKREVFVAYGERGIGRSRLRIPVLGDGTARNLNTVRKLAELAKELA
jgi:uncharacterized protein (DUF1697 family)